MKVGAEYPITAVLCAVLVAVILALPTVSQLSSQAPFPYGKQAPPECADYGVAEGGTYWFCDVVNGSFRWVDGGMGSFNVTFADVLFTVDGYLTYGGCPVVRVIGMELDRSSFTVLMVPGVAGICLFPTAASIAPDHVFGAQWLSWYSVRLLVEVVPP